MEVKSPKCGKAIAISIYIINIIFIIIKIVLNFTETNLTFSVILDIIIEFIYLICIIMIIIFDKHKKIRLVIAFIFFIDFYCGILTSFFSYYNLNYSNL